METGFQFEASGSKGISKVGTLLRGVRHGALRRVAENAPYLNIETT